MNWWIMSWWVILTIVLIYVVYTLSAELILHIFHFRVLYRGVTDFRTVALTFDDGPDERFTPQILEILRREGVKATFFLVGEQTVKFPNLVKLIAEEGHEIGSHAFRHRHAFLRTPVGVIRDTLRAKRELERLTGKPLHYYRSPWGAMNWAVAYICGRLNLRLVFWSVRAIDWLPGYYADDVVYRVVHAAHPGAIILCHDAGGAENAPLNTISALPTMIRQLRSLGFTFSTVGELDFARQMKIRERESQNGNRSGSRSGSLFASYSFGRRILIALWQIVEFMFTKIYHVLTINAIFRISRTIWRHGLRTSDSGDLLIEDGVAAIDLHFQNETLIAISSASDNRAPVKALRLVRSGFTDLARVIEFHPDYRDVQVISAMTLMNRGIEMLGFHVEDPEESKENRRLQAYMRFLMGMYHPLGFRRLRQGTKDLTLKLVWITREELLERYGQKIQNPQKTLRPAAVSETAVISEFGDGDRDCD
jgi:peptidoglycan-N-acetylglucosamine deacetylase